MIKSPQNKAKQNIGNTGVINVAKKATAVVEVVSSIADAAFGRAIDAIFSVDAE